MQREVRFADVLELAYAGLLRVQPGVQNNYTISPEGLSYYAERKRETGEPTDRADGEIRQYLNGALFRAAYPGAYERWTEAEGLLWAADTAKDLTTIGHKTREALQRFATEVVERYQAENVDPDPAKINRRLGAVIAKVLPDLADSRTRLLMALGDLSEASVDLVQRQEHGEQKQGNPLEWTDGRRVVLTVAVTMFEVATALEQAQPPQI